MTGRSVPRSDTCIEICMHACFLYMYKHVLRRVAMAFDRRQPTFWWPEEKGRWNTTERHMHIKYVCSHAACACINTHACAVYKLDRVAVAFAIIWGAADLSWNVDIKTGYKTKQSLQFLIQFLSSCGVVVITFALHAKDPRFDPEQEFQRISDMNRKIIFSLFLPSKHPCLGQSLLKLVSFPE